MSEREIEISGVRLGDVYRDNADKLWEVFALCGKPQATLRLVSDPLVTEQHVIGCLNWRTKFVKGPLRETQ